MLVETDRGPKPDYSAELPVVEIEPTWSSPVLTVEVNTKTIT